jgi:ectoine hydroxylase-related dioxygenase (phytanoyl-CoA dioxygenase family)
MDAAREPASRASVLGRAVPPARLAPLRASPAAVPAALARDGYLYLPGLLPALAVLAARQAILARLEAVDEVAAPAVAGIATGRSRRRALHADLGEFWRSVSEEPALRRLTHGPELAAIGAALFGEPVRAQDYLFLRCAGRGKATGVHCDSPFFTRLTKRVVTCWCALGPVPLEDGPLFVVEGSHEAADLAARVDGFDVARDKDRKATLAEDAITLAEQRGCRLLSADFAAGDVVVFGMLTYHGAFDNASPLGRVRVSCDVRLQPAADPLDPRYFGPEPLGTTGVGYGELNAAKPIPEDWHVR